MVREAVRGGQKVLLEGQLGVMRDLDWGTYPYVTSSNPIAGGAGAGRRAAAAAITDVVGVVKAYCTAVGAGPFPTELTDEIGAQLARRWARSTARPPAGRGAAAGSTASPCRYAAWLNGFTAPGDHQAGRAGRARRAEDLHRLPAGRRGRSSACPTRPTWSAASRSTRRGPAGRPPRATPARWGDLPAGRPRLPAPHRGAGGRAHPVRLGRRRSATS